MSQWDKNLEALRCQGEELYQRMKEWKRKEREPGGPEFGVSEIEDEAGNKKVLYAVKGGQAVQLDSMYDSGGLLKLWHEGLKTLGFMTKVIFFGLGNGMYVRKILETSDSSVRILVYEPSAGLLAAVMEHFDLADILSGKRVKLIVGDLGPDRFETYLYKFVDYRDLKKLIYQSYPNYEQLFLDEVRHIDSEIQMLYNNVRATQDVLDRFGARYVRNIFNNFPHFVDSRSLVDLYRLIPKDIPVIIVASGPSLDKNIEWLKEAKGRSFLISADSAVKALLKHDIVPDLFVSIDAKKNMNNFSDDRVREIPLVCELNSNENLLKMHTGIKYFINDMNAHVNAFFTERGILFPAFSSGGSVANTACSICTSMGFQTIIMVGQDLAYTDNKTHSQDTFRGSLNWDVDEMESFMVDGYYGEAVKTSYEFQIYLSWFEEEIAKNPQITFIDATEGGALIHGARNMELRQVIEEFCREPRDVREYIEGAGKFLEGGLREEFRNYLLAMPGRLEELLSMAKKASMIYGKMKEMAYRDKYHSKEFKKLFAQVKEIGGLLEKDPAMYYAQNDMQKRTSEMLEDIYETESDVRKELIQVCEKGESYTADIAETVKAQMPFMQSELLKVN